MANNITVKDATAANQVVKTTDNASVHTPHHNIDTMPGTAAEAAALPSVFVVVAGDDGTDTHPLQVDTSGFLKAVGAAAHDAAAAGNPMRVAGVYRAANPTVGDGDAVDIKTNAAGQIEIAALNDTDDSVTAYGNSIVVSSSPTVSATAYAADDCMGVEQELANAARENNGTSMLTGLTIMCESTTTPNPTGNILLFSQQPTAATITDNEAFVWSTDSQYCVGVINIASGDWTTEVALGICMKSNLNIHFATTGTASSLWYVFVADAANDFDATTDLDLRFGFIRD